MDMVSDPIDRTGTRHRTSSPRAAVPSAPFQSTGPRRGALLRLIKDYAAAQSDPVDMNQARRLLRRAIALAAEEFGEFNAVLQRWDPSAASRQRELHTRIIDDLTAVHDAWNTASDGVEAFERIHALDSLLMYVVRSEPELLPENPWRTLFSSRLGIQDSRSGVS